MGVFPFILLFIISEGNTFKSCFIFLFNGVLRDIWFVNIVGTCFWHDFIFFLVLEDMIIRLIISIWNTAINKIQSHISLKWANIKKMNLFNHI